ncbi:MAG: ferritin [Spirochaetes bacterium]|jgi:ferritin|nr:ferritin [Spirochaetota bacterium]
MKLNDKMLKALNEQINFEWYSAYIYQSMGAYFKGMNLNGFSNWMDVQAKEEMTHGFKIYNYVFDRGNQVELLAIDKPQASWKTIADVFSVALEHERKVSSRFFDILELCRELKDYSTENFVQWYINEQVEEESTVQEILERIEFAGDSKEFILMLDNELGQRVFTGGAFAASEM